MSAILVVGEDALSCVLGEKLVQEVLPGWRLALDSVDTRGVSGLERSLPRYLEYARSVHPVLCIADTDGRCAVDLLRRWTGLRHPPGFLLRLAVREAESWVLADATASATFFRVAAKHFPRDADALTDAKGTIIQIARQSRERLLRQEMVSATRADRPGTGYNVHLRRLVRSAWNPARAAERSSSLKRALHALRELGTLRIPR